MENSISTSRKPLSTQLHNSKKSVFSIKLLNWFGEKVYFLQSWFKAKLERKRISLFLHLFFTAFFANSFSTLRRQSHKILKLFNSRQNKAYNITWGKYFTKLMPNHISLPVEYLTLSSNRRECFKTKNSLEEPSSQNSPSVELTILSSWFDNIFLQ